MTAVIATVLGACAVAVAVLAYAVWHLHRQVHSLSGQVQRLSRRDTETRDTETRDTATRDTETRDTETLRRPRQASGADPDSDHDVDESAGQAAAAETARHASAATEPVAIITDVSGDTRDDVDITMGRVASVTLAAPMIKVAALSYGLRRALDDESRMRIGHAVRRELKRQRKLRRRRRAGRAPAKGWRP